MSEIDALLAEVIGEARSLGIPVSARINPKVKINRRAKRRFGSCTGNVFGYEIELSEMLLAADKKAVKETLAHEALHTCRGCRNHGERWKSYAAQMNEAFGYSIVRAKSGEALGLKKPEGEPRYLLVCEKCSAEFPRMKKTRFVEHPERYHCRCGGAIRRLR